MSRIISKSGKYMDDSFSIADVAPWLVEELADNVENLAQNGDGSNTSDIAA